MYEEYYGFTEKPFSLTPDPKYLFKSESHANAFELLQYAARRREGFVVVTGDIGTGKTTLCRALLEEIDRNTFTALVLNPFLSEEDLLKLILQDFGVVSREDVKRGRLANVSKQELIETIYDFLLGLLPLRASAVLIIDEAQNLPMPVLEQIRILSNLETDKDKLLQIVLVGQLNLNPILKAPQMRQLDQRVSIRYQLRPLTRDEVAAYVSHRLNVAGGSASVTFHAKALDLVHRRSSGIPRLVNLLCDRALLAAYSARTNRVTADIVRQAAESLELVEAKPLRFNWFRRRASVVITAAAAAVSVGVAGGLVAPLLRSAAVSAMSPDAGLPHLPAPPHKQAPPVAAPIPLQAQPVAVVAGTERTGDSAHGYAVMAASFPMSDLSLEGSAANARLDAVIGQLQKMGYGVRLMDVRLKQHGDWRRVLVGDYATIDDARAEADRLHHTAAFSDAEAVKF
jgi:general secretion pathway protein A